LRNVSYHCHNNNKYLCVNSKTLLQRRCYLSGDYVNTVRTITQLLIDWTNGDKESLEKLIPIVYDEMRKIAHRYLRREYNQKIEATELVHEAYIRIIDQNAVSWKNRAHFFGIAAQMMRRILVNIAIAHQTAKRGGNTIVITLNEAIAQPERQELDLTVLNEALEALEATDKRKSQIVEMRFFGGLSLEEIAEVLELSLTTVKRDWRLARAWLYGKMKEGGGNEL
jgi:RNA polymerase sigma-70 factor, ECF subfamily